MCDLPEPEFYNCTFVRARKTHKCCECNKIIEKSESYYLTRGKWDGNVASFKHCKQCYEAMRSFTAHEEYIVFTELKDSLKECHPTYAKDYFSLLKRGVFKDAYEDLIQEYKNNGYIFDEDNNPLCNDLGDHKREIINA